MFEGMLSTSIDFNRKFFKGYKVDFTSFKKGVEKPFSEKKLYKYNINFENSIAELIPIDDRLEIHDIIKYNLDVLKYNKIWKEQVKSRLYYLVDVIYDEISNISKKSLEQFFQFFQFNNNIKKPDITLNDDGMIRSDWKIDKSQFLSITFLENGGIKFMIFKPNPKYSNKINRMAGTDHIDSILTTIELNKIFWIYDR